MLTDELVEVLILATLRSRSTSALHWHFVLLEISQELNSFVQQMNLDVRLKSD